MTCQGVTHIASRFFESRSELRWPNPPPKRSKRHPLPRTYRESESRSSSFADFSRSFAMSSVYPLRFTSDVKSPTLRNGCWLAEDISRFPDTPLQSWTKEVFEEVSPRLFGKWPKTKRRVFQCQESDALQNLPPKPPLCPETLIQYMTRSLLRDCSRWNLGGDLFPRLSTRECGRRERMHYLELDLLCVA